MKKERLNISFDKRTIDAIKQEATVREVSMSQVVREIVRKTMNGQ